MAYDWITWIQNRLFLFIDYAIGILSCDTSPALHPENPT